jgi:serine/threonine protein kinase
MTPERWRQVEDVLQAAIDCPLAERASFLDEACAGDVELKLETTALLLAFDEAGDFIEQPAIAQNARVLLQETPDENLGREVGHYKIVSHLGAGGMGEVYLAQDMRLYRPVALKILPSYFVSDGTRLRRFQREARAASALNHPNIFTIHEVGEHEGVHFIATEYIDGETLRELVRHQALTIKEVLEIAVQIASALAAAHAAGIVHRDIKPENVMLRRDRIIKILDFGIAKLTEQDAHEASEASTLARVQTETGVVLGTVGYMSPEQARSLEVDARTDIWSLGVVLYEMLARRAPFARATRMDTLVAILEREPQPLAEVIMDAPTELTALQQIISKALRKEPHERYQSVTQMLADLNSVRQGIELAALMQEQPAHASASTTSVSHAAVSLKPSPRKLSAVLIVAALLTAAIAGVLVYRHYAARARANASAGVATTQKLYAQMTESEQLAFISEQEQRISAMMGERPMRLNEEALRAIKRRVDFYVARTGSISDAPGEEDLRTIYARAVPFVPLISRSFAARKVPVIIGLYLPMIESEYKTCFESKYGAKGLFQFLPQTAKSYGVAYEEMCDVEKMTPAAAHYLADRMAELGDDAQSMTLVLLSYNYGAEGTRDALRELRETEHYERNFWTLFAHRDRLDEHFRNESVHYVPAFFAAAIVGENPQSFGLQTPPLSSLANAKP